MGANGWCVAEFVERKTDARLIAAVPDMLAALHVALNDCNLSNEAIITVEDAIAKAEAVGDRTAETKTER